MTKISTMLLGAAILGGASLLTLAPASAMPLGATKSAAVASSDIQTVGWRCGPHRHMNRWGHCVRNRPWRR